MITVNRQFPLLMIYRDHGDWAAGGLTSGYASLGAVIAGPRVAEPFWRPGARAPAGGRHPRPRRQPARRIGAVRQVGPPSPLTEMSEPS